MQVSNGMPGRYSAEPRDVAATEGTALLTDIKGRAQVYLATRLRETQDAVAAYEKGWTPVPLTASGQLLDGPGQMKGFYVCSTTSGTIQFRNALTDTTPNVGGVITPGIGYHEFPANFTTGAFATIAGSALSVVVFVRLNLMA